MAKSTTAQILDVWDKVVSLDKKGKTIIRDRLVAELQEQQLAIREPDVTVTRLPIEEGV